MDEQVTRATGFFDEMAKLEAKRAEQAGEVVDEVARMTKQSFGYMSQLSSEWRKLSIEATKRAVEMMSFGGR